MRTLLCMFLTVALCAISGCFVFDQYSSSAGQTGENLHSEATEFGGPHYAKLNSIGCLYVNDMEIAKSANFETIDKLIKEERCFVIPTDKDVFIKDRAKGDIVSAQLRGSTKLFYTVRSNLAEQ